MSDFADRARAAKRCASRTPPLAVAATPLLRRRPIAVVVAQLPRARASVYNDRAVLMFMPVNCRNWRGALSARRRAPTALVSGAAKNMRWRAIGARQVLFSALYLQRAFLNLTKLARAREHLATDERPFATVANCRRARCLRRRRFVSAPLGRCSRARARAREWWHSRARERRLVLTFRVRKTAALVAAIDERRRCRASSWRPPKSQTRRFASDDFFDRAPLLNSARA